MEKIRITDYTDILATFMRIKDSKSRQDYLVLPDRKDKGKQDGKNRKQYS